MAVLENRGKEPRPSMTKVMVTSEGLPAIRFHTQGADFFEKTYFLKRGDPNQKQGEATQGFLQVLTRAPEGPEHWQVEPPEGSRTSYRRTALANWLTDVDRGAGHLLARVIVNRLWQHHFGRGIVATPSDFGKQGERPSHPELLDWLAGELIRGGWRLKPIHKLIMTSAVVHGGGRGRFGTRRRRPRQPAPRALVAAPARGRGDPRRDARRRRHARHDDVRPRHARRGPSAPEPLLHHQAQPAHPRPDPLRRPRLAPGPRGAVLDHGRPPGPDAPEQPAGPRVRTGLRRPGPARCRGRRRYFARRGDRAGLPDRPLPPAASTTSGPTPWLSSGSRPTPTGPPGRPNPSRRPWPTSARSSWASTSSSTSSDHAGGSADRPPGDPPLDSWTVPCHDTRIRTSSPRRIRPSPTAASS